LACAENQAAIADRTRPLCAYPTTAHDTGRVPTAWLPTERVARAWQAVVNGEADLK
jgi:hypothetical protein